MSQFFCHLCSVAHLVTPELPVSLTGTPYQLGKYIKHTAPTGTYPLNSIFDDPTYTAYSKYIVTGTMSGFLEVDGYGRKNFIWYAGENTGAEYQNGIYVAPTSGVKIVLPENSARLHAFPLLAQPSLINYCQNCGVPLPMW
jgi:hypothetical protein